MDQFLEALENNNIVKTKELSKILNLDIPSTFKNDCYQNFRQSLNKRMGDKKLEVYKIY